MKRCPRCKKLLDKTIFHNVEADYCPICLGIFFDEDELRLAKDARDKDLKWLDVDLWQDETKFKIVPGIRICPCCRIPVYEVYYGSSKIVVDVCNLCRGIWLDRGEFRKIINYLKEKTNWEVLNNYAQNLFLEASEIFLGPETLREEIGDFLTILKLLNYKFASQHPAISRIILALPR